MVSAREGIQKTLLHLASSLLIAGVVALPAWAKPASVESLKFENNTLVISASQKLNKPGIETWESAVNNIQTQMVVLDLDNATADKTRLEELANTVLRSNPAVKRLIITPTGSDSIRVVLEFIAKPGAQLTSELIEKNNELKLVFTDSTPPETGLKTELTQAQTQLKALKLQAKQLENDLALAKIELAQKPAHAQETENSQDVAALEALRDELAQSNQELVKKLNRSEKERDNAKKHLQAALEENVRLQEKNGKGHKAEKNTPPENNENGQYVEAEKYAELLNSYKQLTWQQQARQQEFKTLQEEVYKLRDEVINQNSLLRQATPGSPENIQNLKTALMQNALKLKAAEMEIAQLKAARETHTPQHHQNNRDFSKALDTQEIPEELPQQPPKIIFKPAPVNKAELESTIRNQPDNYDAYMQLQTAYIRDNDYDRAEAVLQNLLMVNPRHADAYYALSELYLMQNNPIHARAALSTYKRLRPNDTDRITIIEHRIQATNPQ